jgi:hypothetical protein
MSSSAKLLLRAVATLASITSYNAATAQSTVGPSLCSCSPSTFNFELNVAGNCDATSLTGVTDDLCLVIFRPPGITAIGGDKIEFNIDDVLTTLSEGNDRRKKYDYWRRRLSHDGNDMSNRNKRGLNSITTPVTITNVEIWEYDSSGAYTVINNKSFSDQSLSGGDVIEFTSISSKLNPNIPLEDQLQYLPGGLILRYVGFNINNEEVNNIVAWEYNVEDCTTEQITDGNFIGWLFVENVTLASGAFCPVNPTFSPTAAPSKQVVDPTSKPVKPPSPNGWVGDSWEEGRPQSKTPTPTILTGDKPVHDSSLIIGIQPTSSFPTKSGSPVHEWLTTTSPIYNTATSYRPTKLAHPGTKKPSHGWASDGHYKPSVAKPSWSGKHSGEWLGNKSGKSVKSGKSSENMIIHSNEEW